MRFDNVNPGEHPELIVIGLGNYDKRLADTRGSIGFDVIDYIESVSSLGSGCKRQLHSSFCDKCLLDGVYLFIAKPNVFMDNVGMSVNDIMKYYRMHSERLIVIYGDSNVPAGQFNMSFGKEEIVHNGIKSIIQHIKTDEFMRIAVGVGNPPDDESKVRYMNSTPSKDEYDLIKNKHPLIKKAIISVTKYGVERTIKAFEVSKANIR